MANDVTFVPGDQDRLNVGKVLVQGCTPDSGFFCDLRHRHRPRPVLSYKGCGSVNDGFAHTDAVRLYGLVPVRHQPRIAWRRHSVSRYDTLSATLARHDLTEPARADRRQLCSADWSREKTPTATALG